MKDITDSEIIEYIKNNNATTRETAEYFRISRQTVTNRIRKSKDKETKKKDKKNYKIKKKMSKKSKKWLFFKTFKGNLPSVTNIYN